MKVFEINFQAEEVYASLLSGFVEQLSKEKALASIQTMQISLAVEELVAYVGSYVKGENMHLAMHALPYGIQLDLNFQLNSEGFRYFNFVVDHQELLSSDENINHLGLVIAANSMDRYKLRLVGKQMNIQLLKEYDFADIKPSEYISTGKPLMPSHEKPELNADVLEEVVSYILSSYESTFIEGNLTKARKVYAYIEAGIIDYSVVYDTAGKVLGFMYWDKRDANCFEFFGPYVFGGDTAEVAKELSSEMVEKCARSGAYFLYSEIATPELPYQFFEEMDLNESTEFKKHYRQLKEDMGGKVWSPIEVKPYIDDFYDQLILFRDISDASDFKDESAAKYSVFSVEPDHVQSRAIIVPYIFGIDAEENIQRHLDKLSLENYKQIRVHLDLHYKWQAYLSQLFFKKGFRPLFVKPKAGVSDILIMQYYGA